MAWPSEETPQAPAEVGGRPLPAGIAPPRHISRRHISRTIAPGAPWRSGLDLSAVAGGGAGAIVRWNVSQPTGRGLLAGLAAALGGFGVLQVMWWVGDWPASLPGHPDSRAGTIGDGVVLPVLVGVLAGSADALARREPLGSRDERRIAVPVGLGAGMAGAAVQYAWWADTRALPHWGVPQPHHFSMPGWWHAVFFVVASAWLAGTYTVVMVRLGRATRRTDNVLTSPAAGRALVGGSWAAASFLVLVLLDAGRSQDRASTVTTVSAAACAAGLAGAALVWAAGRYRGELRRPVGTGFAMAAVLAAVCRRWPP